MLKTRLSLREYFDGIVWIVHVFVFLLKRYIKKSKDKIIIIKKLPMAC